jgi:hypothetical protein
MVRLPPALAGCTFIFAKLARPSHDYDDSTLSYAAALYVFRIIAIFVICCQ